MRTRDQDCQSYPGFSDNIRELVDLCEVSETQSAQLLKRLVEWGDLRLVDRGCGDHYQLGKTRRTCCKCSASGGGGLSMAIAHLMGWCGGSIPQHDYSRKRVKDARAAHAVLTDWNPWQTNHIGGAAG